MKALIQRVKKACVKVDEKTIGEIKHGILIFLGVGEDDEQENIRYLADKCTKLRIFTDENDKMNLSLQDVKGEILVVSQFTLYGNCKKGTRPSFSKAAKAQKARLFYEMFIKECISKGFNVQTGEFGADMHVELINDGPVTIWLDTDEMLK